MTRRPARRRPPSPWIWRLATDRPGTVHEVILDQLRTAILSGQAVAGGAINVDDVADRFAVSRIPVREALKTLVGEGLVDHEPRAGYRVTQVTRAELAELYVVREALENAALAVAVTHAQPQDDTEIDAAYDELTEAIAAHDSHGHHRLSRRFHLALTGPCDMHRLLRMFELAWNITEPQQPMSHVSLEVTWQLHADHRLMAEAFHARDGQALQAASSMHYRRLQEVVADLPGPRSSE